MKVCVYLPYSWLGASGIGASVRQQTEALAKAAVPCTTNPNDSYDILHAHFATFGSLRAMRRAKKKGIKTVVHAHTTAEDFRNGFIGSSVISPLIRVWLGYFYRQADLVIAPSEYTRKLLRERYNVSRTKVITNGVNPEAFVMHRNEAKRFAAEHKAEKPIVFGVGLVLMRKGIIDFIEVSNRVNANFFWIGKDYGWLCQGRYKIRRHASRAKRFHLLGYVNDVWGAYSAGDVFLFPSYEENEGIAVLEAAAAAKAIVVRDIPCFRSYMKHGKDCLMARNNDEFVAHVNRLLADKRLRARLGAAAKKMAKEHSLDVVGRKLKQAYSELLETK